MKPTPHQLLLPLLLSVTLSAPSLAAQAAGDPRELTIPNGSVTLLNVTGATITSQINGGYRLTDLEYRSGAGSSTRFDAVLVDNGGAYGTSWWWLYDASAANITSLINSNQARLIDLESYTDSSGNRRFAAVMVDNTGPNGKGWWWLYDTTPAAIDQFVANNPARIVDIDSYQLNGQTRYLALMISNTGADTRQWWYYYNVTSTQINGFATANNSRVYDVEKRQSGAFDCVMIRDPLPKDTWWWSGLNEAEVGYLQENYGARAIDIERYTDIFGISRYAMATINNSNALTTEVGKRMRQQSSGQVGCWLQEVNGANLAWLNGNAEFEPAEALAVLHHAHSLRRIELGSSQPNSLLTVYQDFAANSSGCPVDTNPTVESLVTVLDRMMTGNDVRRTQAVTNYYGQSNINITASPLLAMNTTQLRHRIGCPNEAFSDPNRTSLRDLHRLHEAVANGWLGGQRERFYDLMADSSSALDLMFLQEAGQVGLSLNELFCFRSYVRIVRKGGDYELAAGAVNHAADFGWISVPFVQGSSVQQRQFTFGAFVNNGTSHLDTRTAVNGEAIPELLRPTIRSAMQAWSTSVACASDVGFGCGTPRHEQTSSAPPRLATTVDYAGTDGYPNAISAIAVGLSTAQSGAVPLPVALEPIGGEPGCLAYNDAITSDLAVSNGLGRVSFAFTVPASPTLVGLEYFTQLWSFGTSNLKTSNGLRNRIGF